MGDMPNANVVRIYSLSVQMRAQIHQHDRERVQVLDCLSDPLSPQKNHLNHTVVQC